MRVFSVTVVTAVLATALAPAPHADGTRVIRLISTFDHATVLVDRDPYGAVSRGDVIVSFDRLANAAGQFGRAKGAHVGHDRGVFRYLSPTRMRIDGWTSLPGGRMHLRSLVRALRGGVVEIDVVGGTGALAGAHGTVTVTPYPTTARTLLIYRVRIS
jgi:hypothetical protein